MTSKDSSAYTSTQYDKRSRLSLFVQPQGYRRHMQSVKPTISLCQCKSWSETSLVAKVLLYVLSYAGSYIYVIPKMNCVYTRVKVLKFKNPEIWIFKSWKDSFPYTLYKDQKSWNPEIRNNWKLSPMYTHLFFFKYTTGMQIWCLFLGYVYTLGVTTLKIVVPLLSERDWYIGRQTRSH